MNRKKPIVLKFGGTSLRDEKSRIAALKHVQKHVKNKQPIVIVVSAMGRQGDPYATDTLINLLKQVGEPIPPRELDMMMSVGEIISAVYFAHLLNINGIKATALTGGQAGIMTDENAGNADVVDVKAAYMERLITNNNIPIVAGFQGVDRHGDIRTLGRGGSDTTAVGLGAYLKAECTEIYTDVDGIANVDPRIIPKAEYIDEIEADIALAMAQEGSKVIHPRAVQTSFLQNIPIRIKNTFSNAKGTLIHHKKIENTDGKIISIAHRTNLVLAEIDKYPDNFKENGFIKHGKNRVLIPNDVNYLKNLTELRKFTKVRNIEKGWGTVSLIGKNIYSNFDINDSEIVFKPNNILRYLVKSDKQNSLIKSLYNNFFI